MARLQFLRCSVIVLALVATAASALPHAAQYFGQNKVHYRSFDFQILRTEHFDIYFYPSERAGIDIAARMAERWRVRLERLLNHELRGRQPLVLYGSHADFEQTNVIGGQRWARALAASPSRSSGASCCRSQVRWPTPTT